MPAVANLVHQSSTSTGTGNFTLDAVNGKQSFAQAFGVGGAPNAFDYFISSQDAPQWERGTGHMSSATTLVRDTVLEGTNGTNPVNFTDGAKDIINDLPAGKQVNRDGLAPVAFSGDYGDLSGTPVVGTAEQTHAAASKTTPDDNDELPLVDSAASNVLKKLTWASLKGTLKTYFDTLYQGVLGFTPREKLTQNRSYYVRSDGNDSNNGLANASGGAFKTTQKAMDVVAALDISIYNAIIQYGDTGPFTGCILKSPVGSGTVIINGDEANPSNYTITKNGSSSYIFDGQSAVGKFQISGVHPHDSTVAYHIISGVAGNIILARNNDYGDVINYPLAAKYGGLMQISGANNKLSCSTTMTAPFLCDTNSNLIAVSASTFTWLRNIAFAYFVLARWGGILNLANLTCTLGAYTATGSRFNADTNAIIVTGGAGINFFPGSTAGTENNGGKYT